MTSKLRRVAGNDRRKPAGDMASAPRARATARCGAVRSNSSMPRSTASAASLRLDRARVGGVDEDQLAGLVARPDRRRQRLDQGAQGGGVVDIASGGARELGELVLDAAHLAQPQDRAAADGAAPRLRRCGPASVVTVMAKLLPRARSASTERSMSRRLVGLEPGAEGEHAVRRIGAGDQLGIADDLRLVGAAAQATRICGSDSSSA